LYENMLLVCAASMIVNQYGESVKNP
jgi:hypothetical protein